MSVKVCLVGGAAAASLVMALSRHLADRPVQLTVVEPSSALWNGTAFQPDLESAKVNAPLRIMSLDPGDPDQALRWLAAEHDPSYAPKTWSGNLPPRSVYGDYLAGQVSATLDEMIRYGSWSFRHVRDVAEGVVRTTDGLVLKLATAGELRCDVLMLCVGNGSGHDPYRLAGNPGYIASPYPLADSLTDVPRTARVAVIGAGLTAVDVILGLRELGHQGSIVLASRRGLLPSVRHQPTAIQPKVLTSDAVQCAKSAAGCDSGGTLPLATIWRLAYREAVEYGTSRDSVSQEIEPGDLGLERLRRQFDEAGSPGGWQPVVLRALFDTVQEWWPYLAEQDRKIFFDRFHSVWASFLNPMPRTSARTLLDLARSGPLTANSGLRRVSTTDGGFRLVTAEAEIEADVVISAAAEARPGVPAQSMSLIRSLVAQGSAQLHPDGGLLVEPETGQLLDSAGARSAPIFALGHLTAGVHYYVSAVALLVKRSEAMATFVRRNLR